MDFRDFRLGFAVLGFGGAGLRVWGVVEFGIWDCSSRIAKAMTSGPTEPSTDTLN